MDWKILVVAGLLLVMLFLTHRRGFSAGAAPHLSFKDLAGLLHGAGVEREELEPGAADFSVQLRDDVGSVLYHSSDRGIHKETLDICVPGKVGMVLDFDEGYLVKFRRPGGTVHPNPLLGHLDKEQIMALLERARVMANEPKSK